MRFPYFLIVAALVSACATRSSLVNERRISQAQANDSETLRNELNERWYNAKVPEALEKRRNEEGAFSGPDLPAAEYRKILDADQQKVTKKLSSLVDPKVYSSLQRQMKSKYLVELLKAGEILPRSANFGGNSEHDSAPGIYLELHTHANPKPFSWGDVELHFDYSLLDRTDYVMNPFWDYGAFTPLSASPLVSPGRVAYYIRSYLPEQEQNEVAFFGPISMKQVVRIVVVKGTREALLKQLESEGVKCAHKGGCAGLIVERAKATK